MIKLLIIRKSTYISSFSFKNQVWIILKGVGEEGAKKTRNFSCYNASDAPTVLDWSLPGVLIDEGEHSLLCRPLLLVDGCGGGVGQEVAGRLALALQHRPVQNWLWWSIQHQTNIVFTVAVWRTRKKSFSQIQILNFCYTLDNSFFSKEIHFVRLRVVRLR